MTDCLQLSFFFHTHVLLLGSIFLRQWCRSTNLGVEDADGSQKHQALVTEMHEELINPWFSLLSCSAQVLLRQRTGTTGLHSCQLPWCQAWALPKLLFVVFAYYLFVEFPCLFRLHDDLFSRSLDGLEDEASLSILFDSGDLQMKPSTSWEFLDCLTLECRWTYTLQVFPARRLASWDTRRLGSRIHKLVSFLRSWRSSRSSSQEFLDVRFHHLLLDMLELASHLKFIFWSQVAVLENVLGLAAVMDQVLEHLAVDGYDLQYRIIDPLLVISSCLS